MSRKGQNRSQHDKELQRQSCAIRKIILGQYRDVSADAKTYAVNAYAPRTQLIDQAALSAYVRSGGDLLVDPPHKVANTLAVIARNVKASTFETYFGGLRRMLIDIGREDVFDHRVIMNLVRGVRRQRQPALRARALRADELCAMLDILMRTGTLESLRDAHLLMAAFAGALRAGEVQSLRSDTLSAHGDMDVSVAAACKGESDSEQSRVFLVSWTADINVQVALYQWVAQLAGRGGGWLFPMIRQGEVLDRPCSYRDFARALASAAERAGLDQTRLTTHSLRAGRITEEIESGNGLMEISRLSRHGDLNTLHRYHRPAVGPRTRMRPARNDGL